MGALRVGVDADGDAIYAGRSHHSGDLLPAKVIPSKNAAYVCYNGEEILVDQFEVNKIKIIRTHYIEKYKPLHQQHYRQVLHGGMASLFYPA